MNNFQNIDKKIIYFDNAATSFYKPNSVKLAVLDAMANYTANPGRSGHILSQKVAEKIYETRENLKDFFHAKNFDLIFTKNCTEALNTVIFGMLKKGDNVITTCYEHNSVLRPLEMLKKQGVDVTILDCELENIHKEIGAKINTNTKMIISTFVSNVTGAVCDVKSVSEICKKHNIKYLIDGAQACGHLEINLDDIDCDFFAFAGHKGLLSLTGVGGIFVKNINEIKPLIYGGTGTDSKNLVQPTDTIEGFEAGTIPSVSIISLNAGVKFLKRNFSKILEKEQKLTEYLYRNLKNLNFLTIYSKNSCNNVVSFNFLNIDSGSVANELNEKFNICVRSGLHCSPLIHKKIKTDELGAVRISVDFNNTFDEIDVLVSALKKIFNDSKMAEFCR